MFILKSIILLFFTILVICESGFVDHLSKCEINDGDCEKDLVQTVLRDIAKTGIPEVGIPAIDPIILKDETISILNLLNFTLVEGYLKGIKDCKIDKYFTDVDNGQGFMEMSCDSLTLKGQYKVFASSPLIKTFLGEDTLKGDGNLKLKIENLHLRSDYYFNIQQRGGEIYIKSRSEKTVYKQDVGDMHFYVDGLCLGKQDASEMVASLLNENWKLLMTTFGNTFMDKATGYVNEYLNKFFDNVPAKYYILTDLTKYVKP